ncbi:hypothetical protein [Dyadobacter psychrotolerans]|uniref:Rpn family recombination-promoting nuclease/putative transposase n=1 Tax=Dyadobacter psychrotolerans TaxID=2541721 RepID=A0A4R5DZS9_9BACT|nr:hypothetical protein [Dyadobacter psychrotolerans]TDE18224.1 hypothetical protein E0F88_01380 [Dyadobacter psychrotolerans]
MRRKNDILLKSAFEEAFPGLLRFFFNDTDSVFKMERGFEFMDKELLELFPELAKKGGSRIADMLVKTYLRNGNSELLLIHLEIQGEGTRDFARRMFTYWYRIYDRYDVNLAALAVFTGGKNQKRPDHFHKEFLGTEVHYKYNAYHILDHSEAQLLAMDNLFALIILAAQKVLLNSKISEEELDVQRLVIARALIESKRYDLPKIRRFLFFLKTFIHIGNPEINSNFDKQIDLLTGNKRTMGIIETIKMLTLEEGIEKGRETEKVVFVKNLLRQTDFDALKIAELAGVSEAFVIEIKHRGL